MKKRKDKFLLHASWVNRIEEESRTDQEYKDMFTAMCAYALDGEETQYLREWMRAALDAEDKAKCRRTKEYKEWRMNVFSRDRFTCVICGQVGGTLNAHHIKPFAEYPDFRLDVDNGVTLCESCHKKVHRRK